MAKFLANGSIVEACKTHLSEEFREWCRFEQQTDMLASDPKSFLLGHVNYILHPPKGSKGVTEAFLEDAIKMCLIGLEKGFEPYGDASFCKYMGEACSLDHKPFDALAFLGVAQKFYEEQKILFRYELEEIITLKLVINYRLSNTYEQSYPNDIAKRNEIEKNIYLLEKELEEYKVKD